MDAIQLQGVDKVYEFDHQSVRAVADVSFAVREREFVSLIGPSGCGKSTVLRMVAGLVRQTGGTVSVLSHPPAWAKGQRLMGLVDQECVLLPWRSVEANVRLPLEVAHRSDAAAREKVLSLLKLVGLENFAKALPSQLSGGMRQRAAIARALALEPKVLLLDEPFGALDEITRQRMNVELLRIWGQTGAAALMVTHSISEAAFLSDRVLVLSSSPGRLKAEVSIDLPRPRTVDMLSTERFFRQTRQISEALFSGEEGGAV